MWIFVLLFVLFAGLLVVIVLSAVDEWPHSNAHTYACDAAVLRLVPASADPLALANNRVFTVRLSEVEVVATSCDQDVMTYVPPVGTYPTAGLDENSPSAVLRGGYVRFERSGFYSFQFRAQPMPSTTDIGEFQIAALHAIDDQVELRIPSTVGYVPGTSTLYGHGSGADYSYAQQEVRDSNYTDVMVSGQIYATAGQVLVPLLFAGSTGQLNFISGAAIPPVELIVAQIK
jgi:hypothetical protein